MKPIKKGEQKNFFNSVDALDKLKAFRGRIPANFDFKQELATARDEKYDRFGEDFSEGHCW